MAAGRQITAMALYSGGLDSTLACRVVAEQGIRVIAVKYVTPFFGDELLEKKELHIKAVKEKYGIDLHLQDITSDYLELLRNPPHGFGKNFNPCIDCKILLLAKTRTMMTKFGASFLITGEVVGQRPMSQRRDTLRSIERDSGCEDILVRPLCAKRLPPTKPEISGLIDRERLLDFSGRTRVPQMELAEHYGIKDYPTPAGGCVLTDPVLARRIETYYQRHHEIKAADIRLLMVGRQFHLPDGGWLVMGRMEQENNRVLALRQDADTVLKLADRPGPTAVLRYSTGPEDRQRAAGLVVRYGKKSGSLPVAAPVDLETNNEMTQVISSPLADEIFRPWIS
jgi:tRNA-specific 2-thiouridylase